MLSPQLAQSTIDALSSHICVVDSQGIIVAINRAWREFLEINLGDSTKTGLGSNYFMACEAPGQEPEEFGPRFAQGMRAVLNGEQELFTLEYPCHSRHERRWFIGRVTRFGEAPHNYLVIAHENITARKLAEMALAEKETHLRKLNHTKDRLLSIISHDLKTPFHGVIGMVSLLLETSENQPLPETREMLGMTLEAARAGTMLVENMLYWTRSQMDDVPYQPKSLEVCEVLSEQIKLLASHSFRKRIAFRNEVSPSCFVWADRYLLASILHNLLSNALKFTPFGGKIEIHAHEQPQTVKILVQDSGIGISPAKLAQLFQPETHATTEGTNSEKGTGLGLLLCKDLAERQQGRLWLESQEGQGTTVHLELPRFEA